MIVDIHTHMFPEKIAASALQSMQAKCHTALFSDGTAGRLSAHEKAAGVDLAVIQPVATAPKQVLHINDSVLATNQKYGVPAGLLSFGAMFPGFEAWEEELERLAEQGVKGIKLHPAYERVRIDDPRSVAILRKCRDLGLIVFIHSGYDVGLPGAEEALPAKVRRALDAVGPMHLIAAHMGGWRSWEEAARLLPETGISIDTAFSLGVLTPAPDGYPWRKEELQMLSDREFLDIIRCFGADHVLFGTDSPWADPGQELSHIRSLGLTEDEINQICGGNAVELLGLR